MARVLYLTRNGLLEPLGQSQIFPYLKGLASSFSITLVTFEKPEDWADISARSSASRQCQRLGIRWIPLRFRSKPRPFAALLAIFQLIAVTFFQRLQNDNPFLVHARSYVPSAVALLHHQLTAAPFIFDMRALWPEELITAGHLQRGSWLHVLLVWFERIFLKEASGVVSLTNAGVLYLQSLYRRELIGQRILVIPTCADLQRFQFSPLPSNEPLVIGCMGTLLSGWFLIDWLRAFFEAIARADSTARFELISRDPPQAILHALDPDSVFTDRLLVQSARPDEMPSIVQRHTASAMFYAGGSISELGRSPTRMAEVLGCGRPIIANPGIGDVEQVISHRRVGVLARGPSAVHMDACAGELLELLKDPHLADRCRHTAEQMFSLDAGTAAYRQLYAQILG
jgi:glycosyltransferase involved in cell wall biosynthesis